MKTTTAFRIIIAAMAAIPVLASCQKERADETPDTTAQADEVRVITLQFANSTKTALDSDGVTPKFEDGDQILLSNGTDAPDTVTVSVVGGIATCTTKLKGTLTAVYPATAAKLNGNAIEGILVPTVQDGTFKSANICMAENIDASANFVNQTAMLCITPVSGSNTNYMEVYTAGAEIANYVSSEQSQYTRICVPNDYISTVVYVSILVPSGLKVCDLNFFDGIYMKNVSTNTGTIAVNTTNTVSNTGWHNYVVIGGLKWATVNIGATDMFDEGWFFSYGNTTGYVHDDTNNVWVKASDRSTKLGPDGKFSLENYLNTSVSGNGCTLTGRSSIPVNAEFDAAYANWGSSWRIPSRDDINKLYEACGGIYQTTAYPFPSGKGVYYCLGYLGKHCGCLFCDGTNKLFFPSTHDCDNYEKPVENGHYTLNSRRNSEYSRYCFSFFYSNIYLENSNTTFWGLNVRPVSDL